jgi:hypothetical protein
MQLAAVVVAMLVTAGPSRASETCMSRAEARQRFSTSYLYWHGADHCWDATPPGRSPQAQRNADPPKVRRSVPQVLTEPRTVGPLAPPASADSPPPAAKDEVAAPAPKHEAEIAAPAREGRVEAVQVATPPAAEHEAASPAVTGSLPGAAEAAAPAAPPILIARDAEQSVRPRNVLPEVFSVAAIMIVAAMLWYMEARSRRRSAKRLLRFGATRREHDLRHEHDLRQACADAPFHASGVDKTRHAALRADLSS